MLVREFGQEASERPFLVVERELSEDRRVLRLDNTVERALQRPDQLILATRVERPDQMAVLTDELLEHLGQALFGRLHLLLHHTREVAVGFNQSLHTFDEFTLARVKVVTQGAGDALFQEAAPAL